MAMNQRLIILSQFKNKLFPFVYNFEFFMRLPV